MEHKLVKTEFQQQNKVGLQYYVECSCGFQGRLGTEQAAKSQYDNHLIYHGKEPYFSTLAGAVEDKTSEAPKEEVKSGITPLGGVAGSWKPVGAK